MIQPAIDSPPVENDLLTLLQRGLPAFVFRWLQACAAFPVLRLPITLHLGAALADADGREPPSVAETTMLASLPWFRQGWMPDTLRASLLNKQRADDQSTTRDALATLAFNIADSAEVDELGRVTIARVAPPPPDWQMNWADWRAGLPKTFPERDVVFEKFAGPSETLSLRSELPAIIIGIVLGLLGVWAGITMRSHLHDLPPTPPAKASAL